MSVHDANYDEVRKLLGIQDDEPVFILRAQDALAPGGISRYANLAREASEGTGTPSQDWITATEGAAGEFTQWQQRNPERVKLPD